MKRVFLRSVGDPERNPDGSLYTDPTLLREASVAITRHATNGVAGRSMGDPIFEEVTEGRQKNAGYSACGDLCHYDLECLGLRDESILNRTDDAGQVPWKVGVNVSRLVYASKVLVWASKAPLDRPNRGDIVWVQSPDHVCVLTYWEDEIDEVTGVLTGQAYVCEYGGWTAERGYFGCENQHALGGKRGSIRFGARVLMGWLPIRALKLTQSACVPDDFDGGIADPSPDPVTHA